jgi:hypothetical protein
LALTFRPGLRAVPAADFVMLLILRFSRATRAWFLLMSAAALLVKSRRQPAAV